MLPRRKKISNPAPTILKELDHLRALEAQAAAVYWKAWEHVPVRFGTRVERDVPAHWRYLGPRHSVLTGLPGGRL
jgi:hypothetical protein